MTIQLLIGQDITLQESHVTRNTPIASTAAARTVHPSKLDSNRFALQDLAGRVPQRHPVARVGHGDIQVRRQRPARNNDGIIRSPRRPGSRGLGLRLIVAAREVIPLAYGLDVLE